MKTVSYKMHEQQASLSGHTHVFSNNKWDGNLHNCRGEVPIMSIVWEHCPVSVNSMSMTTELNKIYICMIFLSKYIFSPF